MPTVHPSSSSRRSTTMTCYGELSKRALPGSCSRTPPPTTSSARCARWRVAARGSIPGSCQGCSPRCAPRAPLPTHQPWRRSPNASAKCSRSSQRGRRTRRSPTRSTSASAPSRATSAASSPSSARATAPPPSCSPTTPGSCYPASERVDGRSGGLVTSAAEQTELVVLRVGEHDPRLVALSDIGATGAAAQQPFELFALITADRPEVEVESVLHRLGFGHGLEQQREVLLVLRPDLDRPVVVGVDHVPIQHVHPEVGQRDRISTVDDDRSKQRTHGSSVI